MQARQGFRLVVMLLGLVLAACGSGSSGFDPEDAVIAETLAVNACVEAESLTICPLDQGVIATVLSDTMLSIDTELDVNISVVCTLGDVSDTCRFPLSFVAREFPPEVTFGVAARTVNPHSLWTIGRGLVATGTPEALAFDTAVEFAVSAEPADEGFVIQLAVFVFVDSPDVVPTQVVFLRESGADVAFVIELTVQLVF